MKTRILIILMLMAADTVVLAQSNTQKVAKEKTAMAKNDSTSQKKDVLLSGDIGETVVTGYYSKTKNSFTGTAVQVSGKELMKVNSTNLLEGLKVFDPSFQVVDTRGIYGSDPNHIPDQIEIRGQNTMPDISQSNLQTVTSLPVFILDGFEVNVQKVYDIDINRVKSITILKDAAAAAIYGSRAANGVVVIETITPMAGKLQISYTMNGKFEIPDLSSYNLMNAAEVLEFQKKAGVFDAYRDGEDAGLNANSYNVARRAVLSGVDTYWLSKPLQMGFQHKHSLIIEASPKTSLPGGTKVRFAANLSYSNLNGAMKGSGRDTYEAGTKLIISNHRIRVTNDLQFSMVDSKESPYGSFSSYTSALPYYQEKDAEGNYYRMLSLSNMAPEGIALGVLASMQSPVYEARYLNSYSTSRGMDVTNNFGINWTITDDIRLKGSFSLSHDSNRDDAYVSPGSFEYINNNSSITPDALYQRGKYTLGHSSSTTVYGSMLTSYTHSFGRFDVQAILGAEAKQTSNESDSYTMTGFLGNSQDYISYAVQYEKYGRITGGKSKVRTAGIFCNQNYSYDNRYLCDLTIRMDGSSLYGDHQQTTPYWSAGLRWNVHNESFFAGCGVVSQLALRANVGTTGNQNYNRNQASNQYNYLTKVYGGYFGAVITTLGNPDLKGQTTYNRTIGLEASLWKNRLNLEFNYYNNKTKGNLTSITVAPSLGFDTYKANMGDLRNEGFDFNVSYSPVRTRDLLVNVTLNGTRNHNTILKISDALQRYNDMVNANGSGSTTPVFLFKEGESMNTIYAVRSLGIDPGTGKELYIDRYGNTTYTWNAKDQVPVGVNEPALNGYAGLNIRYKSWEIGTHLNYSFGADKYNYTLHHKIENVNYMTNNDRRALTERWQKPGDVALYKAITDNSATKATSRFVQREKRLSMTSLRLAYNMDSDRLRGSWISMLRLSITANDLFYASTIRQERGLSYPFTRSVTFNAQVNF